MNFLSRSGFEVVQWVVHRADIVVKLLYEIHVLAHSPSLPIVNKRLHQVFKSVPVLLAARYLILRVSGIRYKLSHVLRYPICSGTVLEVIFKFTSWTGDDLRATLPKRLFRDLSPKRTIPGLPPWSSYDPPLPFLRYLYSAKHFPPPAVNAYDGYALIRAVSTGFVPLVHFLLEQGASPEHRRGLAVLSAIRRKDLPLVRMLIEREDAQKTPGKKARMEDRIDVNLSMLRLAAGYGARDIAEYFMKEKGCQPDIQTLRLLTQT